MLIKIVDNRLYEEDFTPATIGSAGFDCRASIDHPIELFCQTQALVPLGFEMALEPGFVGLLVPRSGFGHTKGIVLGNLVGIIDADYRGEVKASLWNRKREGPAIQINPLDRVCQMVVVSHYDYRQIVFTNTLPDTERGDGGFGHSGVS